MSLFHALFGTKLCRKHLVWRQNVLVCSKCGRIAGFRYQIGDGPDSLRVFLYPQFEDQYETVMQMKDTYRIIHANDVLGHISFVDFDTAVKEMKESVEDITYHGFDGLGIYVPSEDDEDEYETNEENYEDREDGSVMFSDSIDAVCDCCLPFLPDAASTLSDE